MALAIRRVAKEHRRRDFDCGKEELNRFLRKSARQNDEKGHARTYCLVDDESPETVLGYITLCASSVRFESVPDEVRKRLPRHPVPTMLLARLAIDEGHQGTGLGKMLVVEAFVKAVEASEYAGVSLFEVDAMDENAKSYYEGVFGFVTALSNPRKLFLPMSTVREVVSRVRERGSNTDSPARGQDSGPDSSTPRTSHPREGGDPYGV